MLTFTNKTLVFFEIILLGLSACQVLSPLTTPTTAPTKITPTYSFDTLVSDTDYLQSCKAKYPSNNSSQIGYRNIYPGKTTSGQINKIYGQSAKNIINDIVSEEWIVYDPTKNLDYYIAGSNNIIDFISVYEDQEIILNLDNIITKYGCPDLIIAQELDVNSALTSVINYNTTFFVYLKNGIQIRFEGFPISYSSVTSVVSFLKPSTLNEFINTELTIAASPVTLDEAVIETK